MGDGNGSAKDGEAQRSASGSQSKATGTLPEEESSKVSKRDAAKLATEIVEAEAEWIRLMRRDAAMTKTAAPGIIKAMKTMELPEGFLANLSQAVKNVSLTPSQRVACTYLTEHRLREKASATSNATKPDPEEV